MPFQLKLFQIPGLLLRPFPVLPTSSLHQAIFQCPQDHRWSICIICLSFRSHTHLYLPNQLSRIIPHHPRQATLSSLLSSELTTSNSRSLPLGKISPILALQPNAFLQQNPPVIPTPPLLPVHLTSRTSHLSNNFSMIFVAGHPRHPIAPCKHWSPGVSGFYLHCHSYDVKGESVNLAKERKLLGPDPHLPMVSIRLMFLVHHNYRNTFNCTSISSTTTYPAV